MQPELAISIVSLGLTVAAMIGSAVHVILTKRDIRSAIGWIGLIGFAPLLGIVLYWSFGINRIQRKAKTLFADLEPVELPEEHGSIGPEALVRLAGPAWQELGQLARLTEQVTVNPLMSGNRIHPLQNGDQAYPAMLMAIEQAEESISLMTYIFDNDAWGQRFRQKLAEARQRGVQVRLLIDDIGARYGFPSIIQGLRRDGLTVARFMQSMKPWRFRYSNLRNHRKIMVVDGRIGFTGGMNIRGGCVLQDNPAHPIRDLHFRFHGPVVAELQRAFAEDWKFTTGEELTGQAWFPALSGRGSAVARAISDGPDDDYDKLRTVLLGALSCAKRSVRIASPYFLPDQELSFGLRVAALKGVQVEIFQPEHNNLRMVQWASKGCYEELLDGGCTIWLTPPPFDHSKLLIVDDMWVLVGSANWDPRSLQLNFEFNVEVYDTGLAASVNGFLNQRRAAARKLGLEEMRARAMPQKLRDNLFRLASPYL